MQQGVARGCSRGAAGGGEEEEKEEEQTDKIREPLTEVRELNSIKFKLKF